MKTFPFVYALMSRKTEDAYRHLFQYIESEVMSLQGVSFMTDYERAMRNALRSQYPSAKLYSCWFHFCQAPKKHAVQLPFFMGAVREDKEAATVYYKFLCLPLLPAAHILQAFQELMLEAKALRGNLFKMFLRYYERQWIKAVS